MEPTGQGSRTESLYAELRRRHPELPPQLVSKRSLIAFSHAIEDECCARSEHPVLFGGFQAGRFLTESYARWVELARTAESTAVFADLAAPAPRAARMPVEIALPDGAPLRREWIVVCDAPDLPACMVARERPDQPPPAEGDRRFEVVWSVDARVVREASRICAELADSYRPDWRSDSVPRLADDPPAPSPDLQRASDLLSRTMVYLDASV